MKNQTLLKLIALSLISAIPAFFLGNFLASLNTRPESLIIVSTNLIELAKLLLILITSGAALCLLPSFNLTKQELAAAAVIPTISFAVPQLISNPSKIGLLLVIISGILFFAAIFKLGLEIRSGVRNTLKIRVGETYPAKIKSFFLAIALILSLNFAASFFIKMERAGGIQIPDKLVEEVITPFIPLLENQLGEQIEQQFGKQFEEKLGIQGEERILQFLGEELKETLKEGEGRQRFGLTPENLNLDKMKISPEGKLDLSEAVPELSTVLKKQIETFIAPYQRYLVALVATSLFLGIHFLGRIAVCFCPPLTALSLYILKLTKFTRVEKEMVEAERLKL